MVCIERIHLAENGHAKSLPLNRRAGELYGSDAIAGEALVCQEHRNTLLGSR
jgi:hypothetical protein